MDGLKVTRRAAGEVNKQAAVQRDVRTAERRDEQFNLLVSQDFKSSIPEHSLSIQCDSTSLYCFNRSCSSLSYFAISTNWHIITL